MTETAIAVPACVFDVCGTPFDFTSAAAARRADVLGVSGPDNW